MNDDYVGTVELACGARFQLKAPEAVGISGKGLREDLNGDVAAEAFIARGRGRDSNCSLPPAQTRACAASAHGSYLG